jgi:hypothetical protein
VSYKAFCSHSGSDEAWAKWLAAHARQIGIEVYLFEHDPKPGTMVAGKLKQAIQSCDALLVLLTPAGQASIYVQQEIGFAEASRKLIIPLVWPNVPKPTLAMLEGREYVQFDTRRAGDSLAPLLTYLGKLKTQKESGQAILALAGLILAAVALR